MFSASDFIKLFGFIAGLATLYYQLKTDMREIAFSAMASNKITDSRLSNLEFAQAKTNNKQNDFEKFQFKVEAILENDNRLKIVKDATK